MISPVQFRALGGIFGACGSCVPWLRQNPHEIPADNETGIRHTTPGRRLSRNLGFETTVWS